MIILFALATANAYKAMAYEYQINSVRTIDYGKSFTAPHKLDAYLKESSRHSRHVYAHTCVQALDDASRLRVFIEAQAFGLIAPPLPAKAPRTEYPRATDVDVWHAEDYPHNIFLESLIIKAAKQKDAEQSRVRQFKFWNVTINGTP